MTTRKSQNERILATLERTGFITEGQAVQRGIQNLRARVAELRAEGVSVETTRTKSGDLKYVLAA